MLIDVKMKIKVDINDLNKNKVLLISLKGIVSKYGNDVNICLKNDYFKFG